MRIYKYNSGWETEQNSPMQTSFIHVFLYLSIIFFKEFASLSIYWCVFCLASKSGCSHSWRYDSSQYSIKWCYRNGVSLRIVSRYFWLFSPWYRIKTSKEGIDGFRLEFVSQEGEFLLFSNLYLNCFHLAEKSHCLFNSLI